MSLGVLRSGGKGRLCCGECRGVAGEGVCVVCICGECRGVAGESVAEWRARLGGWVVENGECHGAEAGMWREKRGHVECGIVGEGA